MWRAEWALWVALLSLGGCRSAEEVFADGRVETLCNQAVPVCGTTASCVLGRRDMLRGRFPGGQRVVARSEDERARLVVRILLIDPRFEGTEVLLRAYDAGCGNFDELHDTEGGAFDLAGDDGVIEYALETSGRGDHLLEVFSDMSSEFLMTVEAEAME